MKTLPNHKAYVMVRAATCAVAASLAVTLFAQANTHADETTGANANREAPVSGHHGHRTSADSTLKHGDRSFIEKAAESGQEEVDVAQAVLARSTNADVKKFAQMMVDDHSRANQELQSLAASKNVTLKNKDKSENKWSKKDANEVDRDYAKKMVADHKKDIDLFTKESKNGSDSDVVEFARKTLPTLQHHLAAAQELESAVGAH